MWPKVITRWTLWIFSPVEISGHAWVVYFYATDRIVTDLALESDVVTDVAHFNLVLVHCADVWLHFNDTSSGQSVFSPFLVEPFVVHQSVQKVLCLALLQFFGGQGVCSVQDVGGRSLAVLRAYDQIHSFPEQLQFSVSII